MTTRQDGDEVWADARSSSPGELNGLTLDESGRTANGQVRLRANHSGESGDDGEFKDGEHVGDVVWCGVGAVGEVVE